MNVYLITLLFLVKVSLLSPRFWILPSALPHILELVLRYMCVYIICGL